MKFYIASALLLVGSCSTIRNSEKVTNLKESIIFEDKAIVQTYLKTITTDDLKTHLYEITSEKYNGRKTGEEGHNKVCNYIRSHYDSCQIKAPESHPNYFQNIPKSELPEEIKAASQNVVAYIEGSQFPEEYIIISAHSDHEGVIDNKIHHGADDNGSGTAAVLEMAEAFSIAVANGHRPKRSIVFLNVAAEEVGLVGSLYYTKNPVFPLENTIANLNTDMIGRVDNKHKDNENYVYLIGSDRLSTELDFITRTSNQEFTNLELDYTYNAKNDVNSYYTRSDHYNFALNDIPVVFFFNGEHDDYHKSSDTADKINFPLLKKRTDLIFATAWYIANSTNRLSNEVL
jgi:Zn-dependent M28 family amino/carboxypeptidase